MPFITEELWHALGQRDRDLIVAQWPKADARSIDPAAVKEIDWLIRIVSEVRAVRSELGVPPSAKIHLHLFEWSEKTKGLLTSQVNSLTRLARLSNVLLRGPAGIGVNLNGKDIGDFHQFDSAQRGAAQVVVDGETYFIPLEGVIDLEAERARLAKAIAAAEKERDSLGSRLGNPNFIERAKPEAVEKARADHAEKAAEAERLQAALARLG
jgi:valyl-tRNA synthetase